MPLEGGRKRTETSPFVEAAGKERGFVEELVRFCISDGFADGCFA